MLHPHKTNYYNKHILTSDVYEYKIYKCPSFTHHIGSLHRDNITI